MGCETYRIDGREVVLTNVSDTPFVPPTTGRSDGAWTILLDGTPVGHAVRDGHRWEVWSFPVPGSSDKSRRVVSHETLVRNADKILKHYTVRNLRLAVAEATPGLVGAGTLFPVEAIPRLAAVREVEALRREVDASRRAAERARDWQGTRKARSVDVETALSRTERSVDALESLREDVMSNSVADALDEALDLLRGKEARLRDDLTSERARIAKDETEIHDADAKIAGLEVALEAARTRAATFEGADAPDGAPAFGP